MNPVRIVPNAGSFPPLEKNKNKCEIKVKNEYKMKKEIIDDCLKELD